MTVAEDRALPVRTGLAGGWLVLARLGWVVITTLTLAVSTMAFLTFIGQGAGPAFQQGFLEMTPEIVETMQALGFSSDQMLSVFGTLRLVGMLVFAVTGLVVFSLKSDDWMTILVSVMLLTMGAALFAPLPIGVAVHPEWAPAAKLVGSMGPPWPDFGRSLAGLSFVLATYFIPDGRPVPRLTRYVLFVLAAQIGLWTIFPASPFNVNLWPSFLQAAWTIGLPVSGVTAQVYRFSVVTDTEERRKTRLVVLALGTATGVFVLLALFNPELGGGLFDLGVVTPRVRAVYELLLLGVLGAALLLFPVAIAISVLRYGLWDVNVLVNRALVYGSLTGVIVVVGLGLVFVLSELLAGVFGQVVAEEAALVSAAVVLTLLFQPARRQVQQVVDRSFYRRKYDAARTLEGFSSQLRQEVDLDSLADDLLSVVRTSMQPGHVSLWLRNDADGGAFQPVRQR
jgi:hypothetical protein